MTGVSASTGAPEKQAAGFQGAGIDGFGKWIAYVPGKDAEKGACATPLSFALGLRRTMLSSA